jgi:hypothetical protein
MDALNKVKVQNEALDEAVEAVNECFRTANDLDLIYVKTQIDTGNSLFDHKKYKEAIECY